jgi:hypothetical protein
MLVTAEPVVAALEVATGLEVAVETEFEFEAASATYAPIAATATIIITMRATRTGPIPSLRWYTDSALG